MLFTCAKRDLPSVLTAAKRDFAKQKNKSGYIGLLFSVGDSKNGTRSGEPTDSGTSGASNNGVSEAKPSLVDTVNKMNTKVLYGKIHHRRDSYGMLLDTAS